MQKRPDQPWPSAARGLEICLEPGIHAPAELDGAPDMVIRGCEGAIIQGSLRPRGGEPECSLRIHDGAQRLQIIGPLEVRNSNGRGIRITAATSIALSDLTIRNCRIEGIITGGCAQGTYEDITVSDSGRPAAGYTEDQLHGLYLSGNASGSRVTGLTVSRVTGSGLQANGAGMNAIINGLEASEMVFEHCGSGGTPPISLMAVRNAAIYEFCADWTAGDRWAVCFDDGKGQKYNCRNVAFHTYTVPRGTECAVEAGSSDITWDPAGGWSPESGGPEPEPPEPEADVDAALADIDNAKAAIHLMLRNARAVIVTGRDALTFLARAERALEGD